MVRRLQKKMCATSANSGNRIEPGPDDVTEEAGHADAVLLGDRLDHEVGAVADVRDRAHHHGAARHRGQQVARRSGAPPARRCRPPTAARCRRPRRRPRATRTSDRSARCRARSTARPRPRRTATGCVIPSEAPALLQEASAGIIVMNTPRKTAATSTHRRPREPIRARTLRGGVVFHDSAGEQRHARRPGQRPQVRQPGQARAEQPDRRTRRRRFPSSHSRLTRLRAAAGRPRAPDPMGGRAAALPRSRTNASVIEHREQRQQHAVDQRPGRRQAQRPGERHAPQETEEQRRIAERREQAARVRRR